MVLFFFSADSYYDYSVWEGTSSLDQHSSSIRLIDGENVARIRRAAPEKSMVSEESKKDPAKEQPSMLQPQQQQQSVPTSVQSVSPNTTSALSDVTYSTVHSTSEPTVTAQPVNVSYVLKKNAMSQPVNQSTRPGLVAPVQPTPDNPVSTRRFIDFIQV